MKDFDEWNKIKKNINNINTAPLFSEREIWWCGIGENIGFEQNGKGRDFLRPILIIRKFNKYIFYGLPITSKKKQNNFHSLIVSGKIEGSVILSQMRLIDAKRLSHRVSKIDSHDFVEIIKKLKDLIL